MSLDNDLTADVSDELFWDPKVDNTAIAVSADDGKITLRGTVGSLREKREAKKAAQRVFGVTSVDDKLQVKLMNEQKRADAEIRGDVLQALMLDSLVPNTIDAKVDDGFVTLTGTADWQYQRDEAELVSSNIVGALEVIDTIELEYPTPSPRRRAGVDQEGVQAECRGRCGRSVRLDRQRHGDPRRQRELVGRTRRGDRRRLGGTGRHVGRRPDDGLVLTTQRCAVWRASWPPAPRRSFAGLCAGKRGS